MNLGEKIKLARKNNNISQQQLADYLNISRQAISRWENNVSLPDLNSLKQMSDFFDLSIDYFVNKDLNYDKKKTIENEVSKRTLQETTPYILVLVSIMTLIALLPSKINVPILFFGTIGIIFFMSCLLIYFVIKNYLEK